MEYLCLGIDSVIVSTLYYFYKKKTLALANVQVSSFYCFFTLYHNFSEIYLKI